jgi:transcriptional regulator with XRE-family HTH domain
MRMRQRRALLGLSQTTLGTAVSVTFQQVQKYESGSNRISASRLVEFANALDVPINYFFDEMPAHAIRKNTLSDRKNAYEADTSFDEDQNPMARRETLKLVRAYYEIREPRVRKRLYDLIREVGTASYHGSPGGEIRMSRFGRRSPTI